MSYNVLATSFFERELKDLAKKHRSLKKDLNVLITKLEDNPLLAIYDKTEMDNITDKEILERVKNIS